MTLSLYVLRHAKAEDAAAAGGDHERVLRPKGRKAAKLVGQALARLEEAPDLILSSSAARARETAELAREGGGFSAELELRRELYAGERGELIAQLAAAGGQAERILLVGHQPALSLLIAELAGGEPEFPTAALARIDFELERWSELAPGSGRLVWLLTPEVLAGLRSGAD